jgi:hypothetical protein
MTHRLHRCEVRGLEIAELHVGQEHRLGPVEMEADVEADEILEPIARRGAVRHLGPGRQQLVHVAPHQVEEQALLVGRVEIERPGLHPDLLRDPAHRHGGIAVAGEKPQRRRTHPRPGDLGMGADLARHAPRVSERPFSSRRRALRAGPTPG